jgi:putative hemolysin
MDTTFAWELLFIFFLILLNGFFAGSEIAMISARRSRMHQLAEQGNPRAQAVRRLQAEPDRFLATVQVGVTVVGSLAAAMGGVAAIEVIKPILEEAPWALVRRVSEPLAIVMVVAAISYASLVIGELIPKSLALRYAEGMALATARVIEALAWITAPVVRLLTATTRGVIALFGVTRVKESPFYSEEEVKFILREGAERGVFEEAEEELIQGVFKFTDTAVREVMVPRTDMVTLEVETPFREVMEMVIRDGYSRIPVYREKVDNITGIVHVKDILRYWSDPASFHLEKIHRPPYFVPPSKRISELLDELQRRRTHMAIVIDEYGGVEGLVTLEDLLEEIVGEIQDESDHEPRAIVPLRKGVFVVAGMTDIGKVNEALERRLPEAEFETIGGFVLGLFGRVPKEGEFVDYQGLRFHVLRCEANRILKLRIQPVPER